MKEPKVIVSALSLQNPVMEETVWEQYTVTLQRVSPSVATHTHTDTHSHLQLSFYPLHSSARGGDLNGLTCCGQFMVKEAHRAQITDVTDSLLSTQPLPSALMLWTRLLLVFNSISIIIFVWRHVHFYQYSLCNTF